MTIKLLERRAYAESFTKDLSMGTELNKGQALRKGIIPLEIKAVSDDIIRFIISDGSIDRDNDTVNVNGWQLENYLKNPVVLWAHEHHSVPIGKGTNIAVENEKLMSDAVFVGKDIMEFAHMIYQLYAGGFMNAVSVGFMPDERIWSDEQGGIKFLTQELLEFSAVPVPANPNALQQARSAGVDVAPLKGWAEQTLDEWSDDTPHNLGASRKAIERMFKTADNESTSTPAAELVISDEKQKELRQRNIWEPRLKRVREGEEWNHEVWGEEKDVPAYLWEDHLITLAAEREERYETMETELGKALIEIEALKAAAAEQPVAEEEVPLDELKRLLKEGFELDFTDEETFDFMARAILIQDAEDELEPVDTVKDLLIELGCASDEEDFDNEVVIRSMVELSGTTEQTLGEVVEERDFLLVQLAGTIVEEESKQRVDPAKMVRMFGESLGKHITAITGRLPD